MAGDLFDDRYQDMFYHIHNHFPWQIVVSCTECANQYKENK